MSCRRNLALVLACVVIGAAFPAAAPGNEIQAVGGTSGLVIHGPVETLTRYCATDGGGRLWFTLPGGTSYELVTSTTDPAIANPGDGAFHPFEESEVRAALASLRFPVSSLRADVFLLPYPRRSGLESAAGAGLVLLSPGVRPLSRGQQHAEFVHELGHVIHRALMPDSCGAAWQRYRDLRGIDDAAKFSAGAAHANRPHEIFAEDFRALFGDALANESGTIENASLGYPTQVPGLRALLMGLAGVSVTPRLAAAPNPARGAVEFSAPGASAVALDVFDAQGRRVATLAPAWSGATVRWIWDGHGDRGKPGAGVFYVRARDASGTVVRVTRLE